MALKKKEGKIPPKTEADLIFKSNFQCCICQKRGENIHHLSGRISNHIDNLVLLCYEHHHDASMTNNLKKKLSKDAIIKFREHHYRVIENERKKALGNINSPINKLNEEALLTASKNAIIIIELEKIKDRFFAVDWPKREEILDEINVYSNHSNQRIAFEVFQFLSDITSQTRSKMPTDFAFNISAKAETFFPYYYDKKNSKKSIEIAKQGIHIGHNMTYDATIYLRNLAVAQIGLSIIKFIYRWAKQNNVNQIITKVNDAYQELEETLKRPERNDLGNAQELVKLFKIDLDTWDLAYPPLPAHLQKIVDSDSKK